MKEFDDLIRRKLEQLPIEGTPDWTSLQAKLEGESFDTLLRDQLNSSNKPGSETALPAVIGWESLANKLDQHSDVDGEVFDRILSQKLSAGETNVYPDASWRVLSHRMDTLWSLRKVLGRYKVLEIAAAVALLLTFAPLLRDNPVPMGSGISVNAEHFKPLPSIVLQSDLSSTSANLLPEEIQMLVYSGGNPSVRSPNFSASEVEAASANMKSTEAKLPVNSPFALLKQMFGWFSEGKQDLAGVAAKEADGSNVFGEHTRFQSKNSSFPTAGATRFLSTPTETDFTALDVLKLSELPITNGLIPAAPVPSQESTKWEIGSHAGFQAWNISTPTDQEFEKQAFSRWRGGAIFGASANRKLSSRTALGLGLSYSHLTYDPNLPTVFVAGDLNSGFPFSRTESFDGISVKIAQVPLDFRVHLIPSEKKLNLVAFAGVAANLTLSSSYDVTRTVGQVEPITGQPSELEEFFVNERTHTDVKEFLPGILEQNGRLTGNTFLSTRVGLESSLEVNDRISAFTALSYNHFLPTKVGFGPNQDQLSSLSLTVGAKINL